MFAKLQKVTINLVMSVCLSVFLSIRLPVQPYELLGSHWTDFHEMWYFSIFLKSVMKIQVSLKSGKNDSYFT